MPDHKGKIVLMGSGELTSSMVEVHKGLLSGLPGAPKAVFLDTPAGFQMNVHQIYLKAVEYFSNRVQHPLDLSSFRSGEGISGFEAEEAFHILRESNYIFIGPGSPTYALRHWRDSPIPEIFYQCVCKGGCLVAASAAALTLGRYTLPVYEIYKVGQQLHWVEGLDILGRFGFDLVVIPHWNNSEGGNHDTRFCYMGEPRFRRLEALFTERVPVIGLDEHTACILDFASGEAEVKGLGSITLHSADTEMIFQTGDRFSLDDLPQKKTVAGSKVRADPSDKARGESHGNGETFQERIQKTEAAFYDGLEGNDYQAATKALLELDQFVWQSLKVQEKEAPLAQCRKKIRELIFSLGMKNEASPPDRAECLAPLIEALLQLRQDFREKKQWLEADTVRDILGQAAITVEDTPDGPQWRLEPQEEDHPMKK
jgi:hypothetical protein